MFPNYRRSAKSLSIWIDALSCYIQVVLRESEDVYIWMLTVANTVAQMLRCSGRPKGVVMTHKGLTAQAESMTQCWHWKETDKILHVVSAFKACSKDGIMQTRLPDSLYICHSFHYIISTVSPMSFSQPCTMELRWSSWPSSTRLVSGNDGKLPLKILRFSWLSLPFTLD